MRYEDFDKPSKWLIDRIEDAYLERPDLRARELLEVLIFLINKWTPKKPIKEKRLIEWIN
jgi:hypothetical protein